MDVRTSPLPTAPGSRVRPGATGVPRPSRVPLRLALAAVVALPLIPAWAGSLGGAAHLVTCRGPVLTPALQRGGATIGDAVVVRRSAAAVNCLGVNLRADVSVSARPAAPQASGPVILTVVVRNTGASRRHASVELRLDGRHGRRVVIPLGPADAGTTLHRSISLPAADRVRIRLLVGP